LCTADVLIHKYSYLRDNTIRHDIIRVSSSKLGIKEASNVWRRCVVCVCVCVCLCVCERVCVCVGGWVGGWSVCVCVWGTRTHARRQWYWFSALLCLPVKHCAPLSATFTLHPASSSRRRCRYMYVYIYIYTHTHTHTHIYIYIYIYVYKFAPYKYIRCTWIYIYNTYICIAMNINPYIYICRASRYRVAAYTHTHTHTLTAHRIAAEGRMNQRRIPLYCYLQASYAGSLRPHTLEA
jgi:hypothetical protein